MGIGFGESCSRRGLGRPGAQPSGPPRPLLGGGPRDPKAGRVPCGEGRGSELEIGNRVILSGDSKMLFSNPAISAAANSEYKKKEAADSASTEGGRTGG